MIKGLYENTKIVLFKNNLKMTTLAKHYYYTNNRNKSLINSDPGFMCVPVDVSNIAVEPVFGKNTETKPAILFFPADSRGRASCSYDLVDSKDLIEEASSVPPLTN